MCENKSFIKIIFIQQCLKDPRKAFVSFIVSHLHVPLFLVDSGLPSFFNWLDTNIETRHIEVET